MAWIIDTCVLLDVALKSSKWGIASATLLDRKLDEGLHVTSISVIEMAPLFNGDALAVLVFVSGIGASVESSWLDLDTRLAAKAWSAYVEARRADRIGRRPIADIMIGAQASRRGGLITRNTADFARWFPTLKIIAP